MRGRMLRRARGERGQALIETAFTFPLILLVCISIFEFGRAYQHWQVLTNAAREGARMAALPGTTNTDITTRVRNYLAAGMLETPADATVAIDRTVTISVGASTRPASRVTVSYPFEFIVLQPIARMVSSGATVGAPITITTTATMRSE